MVISAVCATLAIVGIAYLIYTYWGAIKGYLFGKGATELVKRGGWYALPALAGYGFYRANQHFGWVSDETAQTIVLFTVVIAEFAMYKWLNSENGSVWEKAKGIFKSDSQGVKEALFGDNRSFFEKNKGYIVGALGLLTVAGGAYLLKKKSPELPEVGSPESPHGKDE